MIGPNTAHDVGDLLYTLRRRHGRSRRCPAFKNLADIPQTGGVQSTKERALEIVESESRFGLQCGITHLEGGISESGLLAGAVQSKGIGVIEFLHRVGRFLDSGG